MTTRHTVRAFDEDLTELSNLIMQMGGLAEQQMAKALEVMQNPSPAKTKKIIQDDKAIDELELAIDNHVVQLLTRRQPMARDLRETIAALKVSSDLERIGDIAKHVAQLSSEIPLSLPRELSNGLAHMGKRALKQIKDALDAYGERDAQKAFSVWEGDQELDKLYNATIREMLTYMLEDHQAISSCIDLLFAAKYIERAGDHSTNIAETIIFVSTGEPPPDRPKGKKTSRD